MNGICTEQLKISNEKTTMGSVFRSKMVNFVKLSCITNAFLVKSFLRKIDVNQVYVEDNNLIHSYKSFILENYWAIYTIQK